jgi:hypothetical protein
MLDGLLALSLHAPVLRLYLLQHRGPEAHALYKLLANRIAPTSRASTLELSSSLRLRSRKPPASKPSRRRRSFHHPSANVPSAPRPRASRIHSDSTRSTRHVSTSRASADSVSRTWWPARLRAVSSARRNWRARIRIAIMC